MFKKIILSTFLFLPLTLHAQTASSVSGELSFQDKLKGISKNNNTSITEPYNIKIANDKKIKKPNEIKNVEGFSNNPGGLVTPGIVTPGSNHIISNIKTDISGETHLNGTTSLGQDFIHNPPGIATIQNQNQINYHSCLRVMINNGNSIKKSVTQCHKANPNVHDDEEYVAPQPVTNDIHSNFHSGPVTGLPDKNDLDHQIILPGNSTGSFDGSQKNIIHDMNTNISTQYIPPAVTSTPLGNIDCDVSKDIRVLLSPKCMSETDRNMSNGIGVPVPFTEEKKTITKTTQVISTDKMLCEFSFIPANDGESKQSNFHPKTAIDCLKKALSLSYGLAGRTNIVMTLPDGTVSSATCTTDQLGHQKCSSN